MRGDKTATTSATSRAVGAKTGLARVHLLLVDDDTDLLRAYSRYLQRAQPLAPGHVVSQIHCVQSCDEAVETTQIIVAGGERLACALVDFSLGDGPDGIETTLRLWEVDPDVQCTLVTGARALGDAETRERIPRAFVDRWDFLSKPAGSFELAQRVRRSLITWFASRREEARSRENLKLVEELSRINRELELAVQERTGALADRNQELQTKNEELEKALRNLEAAQSQLLHQEKMASIGQLAAGVAHELNNPIGFVHSNLETLRRYFEKIERVFEAYEQRADPEDRELATIKRDLKIDFLRGDLPELIFESLDGTKRVRKIVMDLRAFSHPPKKKVEYGDLNAGIESTLNIVHNELKYKARVVTEFGPIPPVRCTLGQVNQVFMNILVNAAQAIEDFGEIRIETDQDGDDVVVTISDNGPGIPQDVLSRIFEPFFTTKEVGQGTGLGLSISYDIVRRHGGTLSAKSKLGEGTTFVVRLPIEGVGG
ncbi:MAG: ATP-binding protein [Planctomycetota bacterium]|jgi:signal transduction histidine kinase